MRNWYVITGGPSAGKTTLIEALEEKGFHVEHESARIVIDEGIAAGKTIEEIRKDEGRFQEIVYTHKREREKRLDPNKLIFFDRGMQDTYAYNTLCGAIITDDMMHEMDTAEYKKIFLLEPFEYEKDYARIETKEEQDRLFHLLEKAYERSNSAIEIIPTFPTKQERIEYFLNYLRDVEGISQP
ncbi:AAA family ATPase [Candidatus Kaiserbacteria bacterium]|nr:AAA family ATPase [Candidatus Kaiserbacteria bacterium]